MVYMHLCMHLKDCLLDYGPVHVIRCFAFERSSGLLGTYHTKNQAVEVQLMLILREEQILSVDMLSEADDMLNVLNPHCSSSLLESCLDPYNETIF